MKFRDNNDEGVYFQNTLTLINSNFTNNQRINDNTCGVYSANVI